VVPELSGGDGPFAQSVNSYKKPWLIWMFGVFRHRRAESLQQAQAASTGQSPRPVARVRRPVFAVLLGHF